MIGFVQRATSLLKAFSVAEPELSTSEIYRRAKISKTTAYRIIRSLTNERWLVKNEQTGKYSIGPTLYFVGNLYISSTDLVRASEHVIQVVNDLTHEVVSISLLDKQNTVIIMRKESSFSIRLSIHVGSILPAHATAAGKALLSELSQKELNVLYPKERLPTLTDKTIATKTELNLAFESIRQHGISIHDEEFCPGLFGVASLIRDASGRSIAAISIAVPKYRITRTKHELLANMVRVASGLISYRLGYLEGYCPVQTVEELHAWWKNSIKKDEHKVY